jgi:hypothetical protein
MTIMAAKTATIYNFFAELLYIMAFETTAILNKLAAVLFNAYSGGLHGGLH